MRFFIQGIQYHPLPPPNDNVAVLIEDELGLGQTYITLKQSAMPAAWVDADVLAAAQAKLDVATLELPKISGKGHTLAWPEPPVEPSAESPPV